MSLNSLVRAFGDWFVLADKATRRPIRGNPQQNLTARGRWKTSVMVLAPFGGRGPHAGANKCICSLERLARTARY